MRCLKIEIVESDSYLYDLEIDGGNNNYVAEGIVVHNTNTQIGYIPNLNHPDLFFDGNLYVASKGLGAQGLVFKNNEKNELNTYVKLLKKLPIEFGERIKALSEEYGQPIRVFGEIYGAGLQKGFTYGKKEHSFAVFDIQIGWEFVNDATFHNLIKRLGLPVVPELYRGPFNREILIQHRDGKNSMANDHIREGIVIKAADGSKHSYHGRKIAKWISPAYALKSTGEEFN